MNICIDKGESWEPISKNIAAAPHRNPLSHVLVYISRKVKSINAPIEFQPRDPKLAVITSEPMNIIDQLPSNHNRLFSV